MWKMSTRTHGAIDYATSAAMLGLPVGMEWDGTAGKVLRTAGLAAIAYSFCTNYERGAVKLLPMETHLALDAVSGATLLTCAAAMRKSPTRVRATLAGVGAFEIVAALLTRRTSPTGRRGQGVLHHPQTRTGRLAKRALAALTPAGTV